MVKIAIDAGHGMNTPGKRTPSGEREWSFNNKVASAAIAKLNQYENVEILRLDDSTGKTDVPLVGRTERANAWHADVLVSLHHNAYLGKWGTHGGIETYTLPGASQPSRDVAAIVHPLVVKAMGLRDRGKKTLNLHMLRESKMPAILVEGGFMDSTIDIIVMRDDKKLKAQGEAIAEGLKVFFNLKLKKDISSSTNNPTIYKYGDIGSGIKNLKIEFNMLGYNLVVDNHFGSAVLKVVKDFQKENGLEVDGYAGPLTQAKMAQLLAVKKTMHRVIIDGKQVGAFVNFDNVMTEVEKAMNKDTKKIEIQKV